MLEKFDTRWEMNKAHHRELLEVADRRSDFLLNPRRKDPRKKGRMLVALGDFLITFGVRLKARYKPVAH
jgi:hypothetical protein